MIRTFTLGLLGLVLIASPSAAKADIILGTNSFSSAYAEDGTVFDVQDDNPVSFPASNSLIANIVGASAATSGLFVISSPPAMLKFFDPSSHSKRSIKSQLPSSGRVTTRMVPSSSAKDCKRRS